MSELFHTYDNYLVGRKKISTCFTGDIPGGINEKNALECIHYVIEYLLKWDKETTVKRFDNYAIKKMKLDKIIKYIDFPPEIKKGDTDYILSLLYPKNIRISSIGMVERTFKIVLEKGKQFPQDYFSGDDGFDRFCICLKYLMINYKTFSSLDEIYDFFTSSTGNKFLARYRLKSPAYQLGIQIIDALHNITRDEPESEIVYNYYKFRETKDIEDHFTGDEGFAHFCCCLKYILSKKYPDMGVREMYDYFLSEKGEEALREMNLADMVANYNGDWETFEDIVRGIHINMIDVIHNITIQDPDSELYYCFYKFQRAIEDLSPEPEDP